MRVFVTGGLGFTGAALTERLLRDGHSVVVLDKNPGLMKDELVQAGADVQLGSVTDRDLVRQCSEGAEVVLHVAAAFREIGVPEQVYHDVNVEGTRIVVEAAIAAGARKLVYCSTQGVHGNVDTPPGDESSPVEPEDYYQETKFLGEEVVREYTGQIEWTTLRPAAIYGPGDPGRWLMIFRRANRGRFPMFGNGRTFYHPLYIDNLVDAFVLAMEPGVGAGEAYIIADADYYPIETIVEKTGQALGVNVKIPHFPIMPLVIAGHICEKMCKPFGINPPIFPRRVDWFRQVRAFRIDKARDGLGYDPKIDLDEGLRRTGEWYRANGYLS